MDKKALLEWYFAYLRKDAQRSSERFELTPMALVKADQELVKEKIVSQIEASSAPSLSGGPSDAPIRPQQIEPRSKDAFDPVKLLWICVVSAGLVLFLSFADLPGGDIGLKVSLVLVIFVCLFVIVKDASQRRNAAVVLREELAGMLPDSIMKKELTSTSDLMFAAISELREELNSMAQKEILLFDYCPFILCQLNEDGKMVAFNNSSLRIWGYAYSQLTGILLTDVLALESKERIKTSLERCRRFSKAESVEISSLTKKGETVELLWRSEWSESSKSYFCLGEDISYRVENERIKAEMAAMITHDLRAPISGLSFWIDNMLSGCYGKLDDEASVSLKRTDQNLRSILALLENLLDLNKLESGLMPCRRSEFKIYDCMKRAVELLADYADESNVTLELEESSLIGNGDFEQVVRILTNLLSNGINWSPAGSKVLVRARLNARLICLEVLDSGPGIKAEAKDSLFQRWVSPVQSPKKSASSSGIGLYTARKFAELQGGNVGAENRDEGGSLFWFTVPAR